MLGYLIFSVLLNIGDDDAFDLGGLVGAIIGVLILLEPVPLSGWAATDPAAAPPALDRVVP